jgi:hypothetical protein
MIYDASLKHFILLETSWHKPTDQLTDRPTDLSLPHIYRAAIAAKNVNYIK